MHPILNGAEMGKKWGGGYVCRVSLEIVFIIASFLF